MHLFAINEIKTKIICDLEKKPIPWYKGLNTSNCRMLINIVKDTVGYPQWVYE
jgi:hypothetical protein